MSPILVRPVREQLEHDRVIRLLQAKYKRKFEVAINPGSEQTAGVGPGPSQWYPDLVLQTSNRKLAGVVEVETAESVNNLEAMSQWATFGRLKVPFHLYLPTSAVDSARRFCAELGIAVAELWAYQAVGDQLRFTLVQKSGNAVDSASRASTEPAAQRPKPVPRARPEPPARPAAAAAAKPAQRRANGQASRRPSAAARRPARAAARRPAAASKTAKSAAARRTKTAHRKTTKPAASSRAQKRR